jgi:uracil-DNA glycosylase
MKIVFVGISNKSNEFGEMQPLDISTPTGKIIYMIETKLGFDILKTNLVSFTPLDAKGKIRYPNEIEKELGARQLQAYLQNNSPCLVFLMGSIVKNAVTKYIKLNTDINTFYIRHPSYIYVYKRSSLNDYVDSIIDLINTNLR